MLDRIQNFENKFHLGKATLIIAVLSLLSRLAGFGRDLLLASNLGLSSESDIYFTSFRIPDLIYNLLILGTLSVAFIPVFSQYYSENKKLAYQLASSILNMAMIAMGALCLLLIIFAVPFTKLIAPGFTGEQLEQTVTLTRIMLLSPLIFTISSVFSSILIGLKRFLVVNLAPIFYNLGIIFGILFLFPRFGLPGLAAGVIFGALLHALIQIPELLRSSFKYQRIINLQDPGVQEIGKLFLPRVFGIDISYVNLIIVSIIGSTLATGTITAFNYANNIQNVALGVFAISTAIAIFPLLSEFFAQKKEEEFLTTIQQAIVRVLYFIVPTVVALLIFRAYIVRLLLGYGKCDWNCTITTFDTLGILSFGLIAQSMIPILARSFYSRHNTKTPVMYGLIAIVLNAGLSYYLSIGLGITGIAIGFVIATTVNFVLLFADFHKNLSNIKAITQKRIEEFDNTILLSTVKILIGTFAFGIVSYMSLYAIAPIVNTRTVLGLLFQAGLSGTLGAISYILITRYLGITEAEKLSSMFTKLLKTSKYQGIVQK